MSYYYNHCRIHGEGLHVNGRCPQCDADANALAKMWLDKQRLMSDTLDAMKGPDMSNVPLIPKNNKMVLHTKSRLCQPFIIIVSMILMLLPTLYRTSHFAYYEYVHIILICFSTLIFFLLALYWIRMYRTGGIPSIRTEAECPCCCCCSTYQFYEEQGSCLGFCTQIQRHNEDGCFEPIRFLVGLTIYGLIYVYGSFYFLIEKSSSSQ